MRKKIYQLIEHATGKRQASYLYDIVMMVVIVASIVPLAFKQTYPVFGWIDRIAAAVFILDYLLRLATADYALPRWGKWAFLIYPITPMAIVDLLSILPSLTVLNGGFRLLRILRLLRTFRIFRVFKLFRYSKIVERVFNVLKKQKAALFAVGTLAVGYILVSALVIFSVEPQSFNMFFDAVYWATISLTTVGYGDLYPVTAIGRGVTMVSSVLGIAIVALPAGIITAGYMKELEHTGDSGEQ